MECCQASAPLLWCQDPSIRTWETESEVLSSHCPVARGNPVARRCDIEWPACRGWTWGLGINLMKWYKKKLQSYQKTRPCPQLHTTNPNSPFCVTWTTLDWKNTAQVKGRNFFPISESWNIARIADNCNPIIHLGKFYFWNRNYEVIWGEKTTYYPTGAGVFRGRFSP